MISVVPLIKLTVAFYPAAQIMDIVGVIQIIVIVLNVINLISMVSDMKASIIKVFFEYFEFLNKSLIMKFSLFLALCFQDTLVKI